MSCRRRYSALLGSVLTSGLLVASPPAADTANAAPEQPALVSEDPANHTPNIPTGVGGVDGAVRKFLQIGDTIYAGGQIGTVQNAARTVTYNRSNLVAFSATTGAVLPFAPVFNRPVNSLAASPDGNALYVAGEFSSVNGTARRGVVKFDLFNSRLDMTFRPALGGIAFDVGLIDGRLIVGGTFPGHLLALDPTTGADTGYIDLDVAGVTSTKMSTRIYRFAVDPAGATLVALGNFASVNMQKRHQVFRVNLGSAAASLSPWYAPTFDRICNADIPFYSRGVDFSPDGDYFVIATTGGRGNPPYTVCDAASKWSSASTSATSIPLWVNYTGGDSLYSVAVTGVAVYVGGHQRWLDNPEGRNDAGPGAVPRQGIGAIDPTTGKALDWNPGKTRGHGTEELYPTSGGLWVGSDGRYFNGEYREAVAFCPLPDLAGRA